MGKLQQGCSSPRVDRSAYSPSSRAISSYLKLRIVFSHAGVTAFLNFLALHHFQSEPIRTILVDVVQASQIAPLKR